MKVNMLDKIKNFYYTLFNCLKSEKGQTLVEYALLLVLIAIVVIAMVKGIGTSANTVYSTVNSALQ